MRSAFGRRPALPVAAALAVAALTLLLPWAIAFDAWSWIVWGRETARLELDTAGGPSWKPLPVIFTTAYSFAGEAAPVLWLATARAGGLLALAGVAALGARLGGRVAAVTAPLLMLASDWWFFHTALGNSEGLLAASATWAIVAHLAKRPRAALALGVAAGLLRPEAWPFAGLYGLWLWRSGRAPLPLVAAALALIPLFWFGPDVVGAGGALGASDAALAFSGPTVAGSQELPAVAALVDFVELMTLPATLVAVAAVVLGGRTERVLAAAAVAWVAIVAVMAQAGYPGNPRYSVPAAAVGYALAGAGVVALARRLVARPRGASPSHSGRKAPRAAAIGAALLVAAAVALGAPDIADQAEEYDLRTQRRADLWTLVDRNGGAAALNACGPARTVQPMRAMLAWRLDRPMASVSESTRPPAVVFQAPHEYVEQVTAAVLEPPIPPGAPFDRRDARGDWVLQAAC